MHRLIQVSILICMSSALAQEYSNTQNLNYELQKKREEKDFLNVKKYHKRLETVDGVEIASSYIEYLDLAFGDIDDRLKKSYSKLTDFRERISKRKSLLKEIVDELENRHGLAQELSAKDKFLRTRLLRNTEMKSALQNLADIAGYKLNNDKSERIFSSEADTSASNQLPIKYKRILNGTLEPDNISHFLVNSLTTERASTDNSTYINYIEMAYTQVNEILMNDKQGLIEVIRNLKTNDLKLKELEELKIKVNSSLERLNEFEARLSTLIGHHSEIANTLIRLNKKIKSDQFDSDKGKLVEEQETDIE